MAKVVCDNFPSRTEFHSLIDKFCSNNKIDISHLGIKDISNSVIVYFQEAIQAISYLKFMNLKKQEKLYKNLKLNLVYNHPDDDSIPPTKISKPKKGIKPKEQYKVNLNSSEVADGILHTKSNLSLDKLKPKLSNDMNHISFNNHKFESVLQSVEGKDFTPNQPNVNLTSEQKLKMLKDSIIDENKKRWKKKMDIQNRMMNQSPNKKTNMSHGAIDLDGDSSRIHRPKSPNKPKSRNVSPKKHRSREELNVMSSK